VKVSRSTRDSVSIRTRQSFTHGKIKSESCLLSARRHLRAKSMPSSLHGPSSSCIVEIEVHYTAFECSNYRMNSILKLVSSVSLKRELEELIRVVRTRGSWVAYLLDLCALPFLVVGCTCTGRRKDGVSQCDCRRPPPGGVSSL
jgi:hypothetical protein